MLSDTTHEKIECVIFSILALLPLNLRLVLKPNTHESQGPGKNPGLSFFAC